MTPFQSSAASAAEPHLPLSAVEETPLEQAFRELRAVVGDEHFFSEPREVEKRSKVIIPTHFTATGFVYPSSVEQIQEIIAIANRYRLPVWPCSTGRNWGYGSATPAQDGAVVLVLERLNKIVHVDAELAYVVVEPGVTYRQLHAYLIERGLPLWLDCTDGPQDGSVMGNALERGIGETDYGDHFGNLCGLEAVLPDGTIFQSGGGTIDHSKSWNTYKWGVGPYVEGLFSQGNFGVVTKVGIWLRPVPEYFSSCLFDLKNETDLGGMIDALRRLQLKGAIQSKVHIINDIVVHAILANHPQELLKGAATLSDARRRELQREHKISPWTFAAGLYGTKAQVLADIALIKAELSRFGKLEFVDDTKVRVVNALARWLERFGSTEFKKKVAEWLSLALFGHSLAVMLALKHIHSIEKGNPSDFFVKHAYYKANVAKPKDNDIDPARDGCGILWLGPMVPLKGENVREVLDLVEPLYEKYGFDFSTSLMVGNARTVIMLMSVFYDKTNPAETQRALDLYYEMGKRTQEAGYQQYRTTTIYMDRIFDAAPEYKRLCSRLKSALDPNNIIAPNKYGITPPPVR